MKISILQIIAISALMLATTSTLYSVSSNFTVSYQTSYEELAHAEYEDTVYEKGWNYLHIYANGRKTLIEQHRGAGFLEGYVSYRDIYSAYQNLVGSLLKGEQLSVKAQDFIDQQLEYLDEMVEKHPRDLFWQYAGVYLQQLRYMYRGYLTRINVENSLNMYIGFSQFYYLTNEGDLQDLLPAFHDPSLMQGHNKQSQAEVKPGNCNGYVKMLDGKLYLGHSTHNIYQFLLRIFKTYHFPTRDTNVGSEWFAFSSRPGDLISKDDFYVLSSGIYVVETSFSNLNPENYKDLTPRTVPCWLRGTIAANLARNAQEWADYFLKQRSGTHNNQWMIVDPSKLPSMKSVVLFVEEGFSQFEVIDMTKTLLEKGYVASYNMPKSQKICKKLGYQYPFAYENDFRAKEYAKIDKVINNVEDMKKWLINNDNEDPRNGIAPRYDLYEKGPALFGLTDCKIIAPETLENNYIWAYSGPSMSNGRFPPFDWANWPNSAHFGMPRKWNFTWEKYPIVNAQNREGAQQLDVEIL